MPQIVFFFQGRKWEIKGFGSSRLFLDKLKKLKVRNFGKPLSHFKAILEKSRNFRENLTNKRKKIMLRPRMKEEAISKKEKKK